MTLSITFYNEIKYTKDDFMNRDRDFFGNGVVNETDFPLTYDGMIVQVGAGVAWVDGYRIANDTTGLSLTLQPADATLTRIDTIQIGHDDTNQVAVLKVTTGQPDTPDKVIAPAADPGFLALYEITVAPQATSITATDATAVFGRVPINVSFDQIQGHSVATTDFNTFTGTQTAPEFVATSQTAPLQLLDLTALPQTVGVSGTICVVNGQWYMSDGSQWNPMAASLQPATSTTLGGVKAGTGVQVANDGTLSVTPNSVGAATTGTNTFSGNQTAPQFVSTASTGTAPAQTNSTTVVTNWNADLLDGLHADGLVGQRIVMNGQTQDQYWLIGVLPASATTTYDKLYVEIKGGPSWDSTSLTNDWVLMGNRDINNASTSKFNYQYMRQGNDVNSSRNNLQIVAYKQADGSVQVYVRGVANTSSVAFISAYGASINNQVNTALPIGAPTTTVPSGTIVFNSVSYTPNASFQSGSATFNGLVSFNATAYFDGQAIFNSGLSLASGQTLTNNGTISGGTVNATTLQMGGNTVLTSASSIPSTQLPSDVAYTDVAKAWTASQTFNGGMTLGTGQTLTNNGTISGGTINATTLKMGGNNVLTTTSAIPAGQLPSDVAYTDSAKSWTAPQTFNGGMTLGTGQTVNNNGTITGGTINASSVPWTGITGVPTDFAKTDSAQTWTASQTFNAGLTLGTGQTLTNNGTITGGTISATTLQMGGNNVLTTASAIPSSQLPSDVAYTDAAKSWTALQTFSGGMTLGTGQTFTNNGTITGGTINATSVPWTGVTGVPTDLVKYDSPQTWTAVQTFNAGITLGSSQTFTNNGTIANAGTLTNTGTISGGTINASSVPWGGVSSKPTTLGGYGITDAVAVSTKGAVNGVATLDSNGQVPTSQLGNVPPSNLLTMPNAWIG